MPAGAGVGTGARVLAVGNVGARMGQTAGMAASVRVLQRLAGLTGRAEKRCPVLRAWLQTPPQLLSPHGLLLPLLGSHSR